MATSTRLSRAAAIREGLNYPVVDCDGHVLEVTPVLVEYIRETAGARYADAYASSAAYARFSSPWTTTPDQRRYHWIGQSNLWGWPTKNTYDRATATIPGLYAKRMDDLGIDYSILYPSAGLFVINLDPEIRREVVRAYNRWVLELCAPYRDRMTAVATIPMETPEEAIDHLDYAVTELGHKVVCLQGFVHRPVPALRDRSQDLGGFGTRVDYFGLDSEYDYDVVWARCVALKVAATFHSAAPLRAGRSVTNYTHNHIGSVAQAQEGLAKSLFLAGVTRRFPQLNFGFLECGAAWACSLYADLVGHYEKRNLGAMEYVDPAQLDVPQMMDNFDAYADPFTKKHRDKVEGYYRRDFAPLPERDDFWRVEIADKRGDRGSLRQSLLRRMRGRRSLGRLGLQHQGEPLRRQAPSHVRIGCRPLGRARCRRCRGGSQRVGRRRLDHRKRLQGVHVLEPGGASRRDESRVLHRHPRREGGAGLPP